MTHVLLAHPGAELYGSDRMAVATVEALINAAVDVTVVVPNDGPLLAAFREAGAEVVILDVPVLRKALLRPLKLARLLATMPVTVARIMAVIRRSSADVVYVNTITQPWWILAARLTGRRVIAHVREAESELSTLMKTALSLPLSFAHAIPCNSAATEEHVRRFGIAVGRRTSILYNGKDWSHHLAVPAAQFGRTVTLLLVGRISPRKGTDTAVQATAELVRRGYDVRLRLVGDVFAGYEWFVEELEQTTIELGIKNRVDFAGFIADPVSAFADSDIVVVPSRIEPFGTVAAEGMAAGRCTIVARTQGLIEIVNDPSVGSVFDAGDHKGLADACAAFIDDSDAAQVVASSARASVVGRFSTSNYANATVDLVSRVARRR